MGRNKEYGHSIRINGEEYERKTPIKLIVLLVVIIFIFAAGYYIVNNHVFGINIGGKIIDDIDQLVDEKVIGNEGEVNTITESTIKEVFEISELQTADYIYNAVTEVYDDDGDTLKYNVAYEGKVTAGIDFSCIKIDINEEEKEIVIEIPRVIIQETVVNAGTLEYIFTKEKYNDENVFKEAYDVCQKDLDSRASSEKKLMDMACDNAKQVIEALVVPWVNQIDSEYKITVK